MNGFFTFVAQSLVMVWNCSVCLVMLITFSSQKELCSFSLQTEMQKLLLSDFGYRSMYQRLEGVVCVISHELRRDMDFTASPPAPFWTAGRLPGVESGLNKPKKADKRMLKGGCGGRGFSFSSCIYNWGDNGRFHCSFRLMQTTQNFHRIVFFFPFFFFFSL